MKFYIIGDLQEIVLRFEFHQNRSSDFGSVGVEICPFPWIWPLAYTTACTTVQAVMIVFLRECVMRECSLPFCKTVN